VFSELCDCPASIASPPELCTGAHPHAPASCSVNAIHVGGLEGEELEDEAKRTLADVGVACVSPLCAMMCRDATEVALEEFQRVAGVLLALASLDPILVGAELYKLNQPAYYAIAKSAGSVFGAALAKDPQELTEAGARGPTVPTPHMPTLHTNARTALLSHRRCHRNDERKHCAVHLLCERARCPFAGRRPDDRGDARGMDGSAFPGPGRRPINSRGRSQQGSRQANDGDAQNSRQSTGTLDACVWDARICMPASAPARFCAAWQNLLLIGVAAVVCLDTQWGLC
jgi:hypothetical protein